MKRRSAIKNLLIIAGGIAILPSCSQESGGASIQLNNLDIGQKQEDLLAEIAETIIPKTSSPGAKDLKLHLFVLKMVDDCHNKYDQKIFTDGLNTIDQLSKKRFSKSFKEASLAQRTQLLQFLESDKEAKNDVQGFYATIDHWNACTAYGHNCLAFTELDLCKPGMARRASALEFGSRPSPANPVFALCYRGIPPPLFYSAVLIIGSLSVCPHL
jgi:hypothetical protein